ncbi:sperm flagellar protein 1 isoform X2 [Carettochelys insculpta]|uniref:sperm flagellar protein 1 isoform X2 n=1 Tax=Carettochelys insculpta TaxID=44489 RepID=UPI003EBE11F1
MAGAGPGEEGLQELYRWVDGIPLSRPKRNIARDFSDGVLAAEVVKFYFPKMVEMHNYVPANSTQQKLSNWGHLNRKVLNKLNFSIPADVIRKIVQCTPGMVELVLIPLRQKIEEKQKQRKVVFGEYQVASRGHRCPCCGADLLLLGMDAGLQLQPFCSVCEQHSWDGIRALPGAPTHYLHGSPVNKEQSPL